MVRAAGFSLVLAVLLGGVLAGCFHAETQPTGTTPAGADDVAPGGNGAPKGGDGASADPPAPEVVTDPGCAFLPAGCAPAPAVTPEKPVVVAVVDTGINPYHVHFRVPTGRSAPSIAGFPADATALSLSLGKQYDEAVAGDAATWGSVEVGKLYTIPGTRVVGAISMGDLGSLAHSSSSLILDDVGHGTGVASALVQHSPHAWIVSVQIGAASLGEGIDWAASQPWIDVVSVSWGSLGNVPIAALGSDVIDATKKAADAGKLVVMSGGNEPTLAPTGESGPAWVVSVGGSSPDGKGETWTASKGVDVVSDFSPVIATHDTVDGTEETIGTSFATPIVSGTLAEAWWIARQAGDAVDAASLRAAMNRLAWYWEPTDYRPNTIELPVVAPWVQMGWGYVDGTLAPDLAAVAAGKASAPAKPEAEAWMNAVYTARRTFWGG